MKSTWQILNISLISNLQYVTFPHVQMSKNYFIFVLYYVELCYYTISNVSSKIQAQKSVILFKIMVHFILSSAANLQGNNSQRRRKSANVTKHNVNKTSINYHVCEHFCLSHVRRFSSAIVTVYKFPMIPLSFMTSLICYTCCITS